MNVEQARAVLAIVEAGNFDRAAQALHITTSAVSQRVKALESALGQVLVRRGTPCKATAAGEVVVAFARQVQLLEAEARNRLTPAATDVVEVPIAVNADSLATWFPRVFAAAATWEDVHLQIHAEDEEHSARLLRDGTVLAAVSTDHKPVPGCMVTPLGVLRYLPLVHPSLLNAAGIINRLPVVRFNAKDDLQDAVLRDAGVTEHVPGPLVPGSEAFVAAVAAGLGWGMVPEPQMDRFPHLVPVPGLRAIERRLHWHRWKFASPILDRLSDTVRLAAED